MFKIIESKEYVKSEDDVISLKKLLGVFEKNIMPDGVRNRAYLKLIWNRKQDQIRLATNQSYFQTAKSNVADGGKIRNFAIMDKDILELSIMKSVIDFNLKIIKDFGPLKDQRELILGLHFIQYKARKFEASYSSPDSLHRDDEPLVFVHLLNLSQNAWGGDNLIADLNTKEITNSIRLEKPLETIILTRDYYHAVTPLGSREGISQRDILLFTVEPCETQITEVA